MSATGKKSGNSPLANAHSKSNVPDRCQGFHGLWIFGTANLHSFTGGADFWWFLMWRVGGDCRFFTAAGHLANSVGADWPSCESSWLPCALFPSTPLIPPRLQLNLNPTYRAGDVQSLPYMGTASTANRQWATTGSCTNLHARARKANMASFFFHDAIHSEQLVTQARVQRVAPRQSERVEIPPDCHSISGRLGLSQRTSLCWSLPCDPYAARCAATLRALMQLPYRRHHQ